MVGGIVEGVAQLADCQELVVRGTGVEKSSVVMVKVALTAPNIGIGDTIWWQSGVALWTPVNRHVVDYPITRVGRVRPYPS